MKNQLLVIVMSLLCLSVSGQYEENPQSNIISLNTPLMERMLDQSQNLRKLDILMDAKEEGLLDQSRLSIGASIIGIMDYQKANIESKFGYLMRHPTANNQRAKDVSEAALHSVQVGIAGSVNSWITIYGELLYNPMQSFGTGTITSINRNLLQMRKAYILLADPDKSPFYFALGKMDGNFGNMDSTSPFTNSTMWHAFGTLAFGATAGYKRNGFNASLMLIQGGSQFRAAHVPVDGTNVPSQLNNYAADVNYTIDLGEGAPDIKLGASYQKGTAYCQGFPVVHFMPCEDHNPAYSFYTKIEGNRYTINGGFASTTDLWPGTFNPAIPEFEAVKVTSLIVGGSYALNTNGKIKYVLSGEFSDFQSGAQDSPWERQKQWIIGLSGHVNGMSRLFIEVFRVNGYAPLNFISGGNFDNPAETHSSKEANTTGIIVGGVLTI